MDFNVRWGRLKAMVLMYPQHIVSLPLQPYEFDTLAWVAILFFLQGQSALS